MANITTPNMFLVEPGIGTELSPTWAQDLNNNFATIDGHNHSAGSGVQVTPAGIDINVDLPFNGNNAISLRTTRYIPISLGSLTGADIDCLLVNGVDLYYIDGNGNHIRLTASGGIVGTPGSISGLTSPASASYVSATGTFVWQQNTGVAANMDLGTAILRYPGTYPTPTGNYIALQVPSSLSTGYALTLPTALPASEKVMTLDASGIIRADVGADGTSVTIASNTISVTTNAALTGKHITAQGQDIVVSANPATNGLMIVRGKIASNGSILLGEGFTVSSYSGGLLILAWSSAFHAAPVITANVGQGFSGGNSALVTVSSVSTSGAALSVTDGAGNLTNEEMYFIAIGERA